MTFQRFLAEWAEHNEQLVDNRATLAFKRPGVSEANDGAINGNSPAKRSNADDFKGESK